MKQCETDKREEQERWTKLALNNNSTFRVNHYMTKSMEDLRAKCDRGSAAGSKVKELEGQLAAFREPMAEDLTIKPYADIVREKYS